MAPVEGEPLTISGRTYIFHKSPGDGNCFDHSILRSTFQQGVVFCESTKLRTQQNSEPCNVNQLVVFNIEEDLNLKQENVVVVADVTLVTEVLVCEVVVDDVQYEHITGQTRASKSTI